MLLVLTLMIFVLLLLLFFFISYMYIIDIVKGEVLISICFYFCLFNQISKMLLHAYCKTIFHVYCKVCIVCQTSLSDLK